MMVLILLGCNDGDDYDDDGSGDYDDRTSGSDDDDDGSNDDGSCDGSSDCRTTYQLHLCLLVQTF
jgi:hypothetical protein